MKMLRWLSFFTSNKAEIFTAPSLLLLLTSFVLTDSRQVHIKSIWCYLNILILVHHRSLQLYISFYQYWYNFDKASSITSNLMYNNKSENFAYFIKRDICLKARVHLVKSSVILKSKMCLFLCSTDFKY